MIAVGASMDTSLAHVLAFFQLVNVPQHLISVIKLGQCAITVKLILKIDTVELG
jgi:hypothetical protein